MHAHRHTLLFCVAHIQASNPAVCTQCGCCRRGSVSKGSRKGKEYTWHPFRFPIGLDHYHANYLPCSPAPELGKSYTWLPVTHVGGPNKGPTDSGGLWFYYARGCSDLYWNTGRTLLVRNRAHGSVLLERLVRGGTEEDALQRLAAWIKSSRYANWRPLGGARHWLRDPNASIAWIVGEAARGLYGDCSVHGNSVHKLRYEHLFDSKGNLLPCNCTGYGNSMLSASKRRMIALSPVVGDKVLSLHVETLLRTLKIDTLQLHQQPQGNSPMWTTEIWDVRFSPLLSRHLENASAHPEVLSFARHNVNAACVPSKRYHWCMACRGSHLERNCEQRDTLNVSTIQSLCNTNTLTNSGTIRRQ